ncbi:MAG: oligosaccharide flippase family protein [Flavobacteriales bacterium]|nr:oligosaccharide flippase family protein [Flavobacteriales bacterium]
MAVNLVIKPTYILGIEAEVQNQVGPEIYGKYAALISLSFLFNILLDLGIQNYNTRNIASHEQLLAKHFPRILTLRGLLVLLYLSVLMAAGWGLGYRGIDLQHLLILGLNQALAGFILFFRSNLSGLHLFKQDSIISVLDRSLLIVLMGLLLWGSVTDQAFDITWFIWGQTIAYSTSFLVSLFMVMRQAGKVRPIVDKAFNVMILKNSFPYALLFFLMTVYYRTDSIMLERLLPDGAYHAGIYAMGFRLFEAANMVSYLFAVLLLPIFARMLSQKESVEPVTMLSFRVLFSGTLLLSAACFLFDDTILGLRYHERISEAAPTFSILMISFLFFALSYIFGTLMTAAGQLRKLNQIALIGLVLNVGLNLALIWECHALGCAIASLCAHGIVAITQAIICFRAFQFRLEASLVKQLVVYIGGLAVLGAGSTIIQGHEVLKLGAFLGGGLLLAVGVGLLNVKSFMTLMRSRK